MNIDEWENRIIDYIDGNLEGEGRIALEQELAKREEVFHLYQQYLVVIEAMDRSRELEPSTRLKASFEKTIKEEMLRKAEGKVISIQPVFFRAAAAIALVVSGVAIGFWITKNQQQQQEMLALRKEVEATKNLMQTMLQNEGSASQRLQGVTVALQMEKADDDVVNALVKAMNEDANSNVRLAALDALSKFQAEPAVRKALVKSLSTQKDPIVQIALIQLMVRMKEKGVVKELERLVEDDQNMKAVKDEAYKGLLKLS